MGESRSPGRSPRSRRAVRSTAGSPKRPTSARSSSPSRHVCAGQQVDPPFLPAAKDLHPGPPQHLLDQGQEEPQPAPRITMPEPLAQVVAVAEADAQRLEAIAPRRTRRARRRSGRRPSRWRERSASPWPTPMPRPSTAHESARPSSPPWNRPITTSPSTSPTAPPTARGGHPQVHRRASLSQAPSRNGPPRSGRSRSSRR